MAAPRQNAGVAQKMIEHLEGVVFNVTLHPSVCGADIENAAREAIRQQVVRHSTLGVRSKGVLGIRVLSSGQPLQAQVLCDIVRIVPIPGDLFNVTVTDVNELGISAAGLGIRVFCPSALLPFPLERSKGLWSMNRIPLTPGTHTIVRVLRHDVDDQIVAAPISIQSPEPPAGSKRFSYAH